MYLVQTNIDGFVEQLEFSSLAEAESAALDIASEGVTCLVAQVLREFKPGWPLPEAFGPELAEENPEGPEARQVQ